MENKAKEDEFIARLIGTGTWLDWIKKIPIPVFALGKNDIYSVFLEGTNFTLPIDGMEKPAIGFYTTRYVASENVHEAKKSAIKSALHLWNTRGFRKFSGNEPTISIEKVDLLYERFRLRSGTGFSFYCNDDPNQ